MNKKNVFRQNLFSTEYEIVLYLRERNETGLLILFGIMFSRSFDAKITVHKLFYYKK